MIKIHYHAHELPFQYPFSIAKGTKTHQPTLVVELHWRGLVGYGEAPAISYYHIPVEQMIADIEAKKLFIEKYAFTEPERYWHYLHHLFPKNPFLVCALDMAAWDLFGKVKRMPLYRLWKLSTDTIPITDYTIGIDTPEKMVHKIKERSWPVYKVKVGYDGDLDAIAIIRSATQSVLRVDANEGWTLQQALNRIPRLKEMGVELIEQPLQKTNVEGMKELFTSSELPLFADESCVSEHDVARCAGLFHGINIKLTKCSGITPALRMIREARKLDLRVMLGCMNESTIGTAAIAHLSPLVDYVDADGPLLLAADLATGIQYEDYRVLPSEEPGLGIRPLLL